MIDQVVIDSTQPQQGVIAGLVLLLRVTLRQWLRCSPAVVAPHFKRFTIEQIPVLDSTRIGLQRHGSKVVAVRNPYKLQHLDSALREAVAEAMDVVVLTVRRNHEREAVGVEPACTSQEQALFTEVVNRAERYGKKIVHLVITEADLFFAIAHTVEAVNATQVFLGRSAKCLPNVQAELLALRWGTLQADGHRGLVIRVVSEHEDLRFIIEPRKGEEEV